MLSEIYFLLKIFAID